MLLDQSGMLDPDFAAAAFKLSKVGEFTKPVHTQFGYHIIKLMKQDPKGYLALEKVKDEIHDFLVDKTVSEEIQAMVKAEREKGGVKVYDFTPAKVETSSKKNPAAAPTPIL
jgi:foldase protein PrsA